MHQPSQRLLDPLLRLHIYRTGRVIQHQNTGVQQQRACDGNPLFLPSAQRRPALTHGGLVAQGKPHDKVVRRRRTCRRFYLRSRCLWAPKGNVVTDRPRKEVGLLQDNSDLSTQRLDGDFPHILPIDQNPPCRHIIKARDQVDDAAFAASRRPQNRHRFARLRHKAHLAQHQFAAADVPKGNSIELNFTPDEGQSVRPWPICHVVGGIQNLIDPLCTDRRLAHLRDDKPQLTQREKNVQQIQAKFLPGADRQRSIQDLPPPKVKHSCLAQIGHQKNHRKQKAEGARDGNLLLHQRNRCTLKTPLFLALGRKSLDHFDARKVFLQNCVHGRQFLLYLGKKRL